MSDKYVEYEQCADLVCCSMDQVGLYEMIPMVSKTGGAVFQYESFTKEEARASIRGLFSTAVSEEDGTVTFPELNFFGTHEINMSDRLRIRGAFGNVAPVEMEENVFMSSNTIGMGKTTKWRSACISPSSSFTFFFDLVTSVKTNLLTKCTHALYALKLYCFYIYIVLIWQDKFRDGPAGHNVHHLQRGAPQAHNHGQLPLL